MKEVELAAQVGSIAAAAPCGGLGHEGLDGRLHCEDFIAGRARRGGYSDAVAMQQCRCV